MQLKFKSMQEDIPLILNQYIINLVNGKNMKVKIIKQFVLDRELKKIKKEKSEYQIREEKGMIGSRMQNKYE